ncbi:MAG: hypothetical protein JMN24_01725 [gamma proteobacterium endosymbiont of Lamellibrachia anaximandri]|nr:hypothetical protein [gamma proteobacterium endosymbiont of Lamellibrachia anaximandri]MBL3618748.1 hypothetical protein [gamma proteobacterium endosymbiont of Lamellibrachia anaximandri]
MNLKPQDILFLLKLIAIEDKRLSYGSLAFELGMSSSEVHAAAKRAIAARLAIQDEDRVVPSVRNLEEFLIHGIRYAFVPERSGIVRGMPTAHAVSPLQDAFVISEEYPPVWPDAEGEVRGEGFSPLYKSASYAARRDSDLYELLALVDAIRGGRTRERELSVKLLKDRLAQYG